MDRRLYPNDLAEQCKGEKHYRPSNGTEGEMFMERWCQTCRKDHPETEDYCPIIAATMAFDTDDPEYPKAWTFDKDGQPCCTAFELRAVDAPKLIAHAMQEKADAFCSNEEERINRIDREERQFRG